MTGLPASRKTALSPTKLRRPKSIALKPGVTEFHMKRVALVFTIGIVVGVAGLSLAHLDAKEAGNGEKVKVLASYDVKEKIDGKDATATMVEVTFGPGKRGTP